MLFWIVAIALACLVAGLMILALMRREGGAASGARDVDVYRDQLSEVDRDLARGVLSPEEAERLRVEVSRRLLDADRAAEARQSARAPKGATLAAAALSLAVVAGGGALLYLQIGAPGYRDMPLSLRLAEADEIRANRPAQLDFEADLPPGMRIEVPPLDQQSRELIERLRTLTADRPDDLQGQMLLAQYEARVGDFSAAWQAQERVIALKGDAATAQDYADLADLMVLAAGGYVSPEAERALTEALRRDVRNGPARYYSGLLLAQTGRPDLAFGLWEQLLRDSTPDAPWVPSIRAQIEDLAAEAGVRFELPPLAEAPVGPGPTREQVEAAAEMTVEERMEMIRGMVAGLSERLASEGGPPEDWARLIGALGVLGETEQAGAIWAEAQAVFADAPEALEMLASAAARAGLTP